MILTGLLTEAAYVTVIEEGRQVLKLHPDSTTGCIGPRDKKLVGRSVERRVPVTKRVERTYTAMVKLNND